MEALSTNLQGIAIGISTFLIIGLFHPLVIKGEYYFGTKVSWAFLVVGIATLAFAIFCESLFWSALLAVVAFSCFWSIKEVFDQRKRVLKGWFPMNPKRKKDYFTEEISENKKGLHVSQRTNLINQHINN